MFYKKYRPEILEIIFLFNDISSAVLFTSVIRSKSLLSIILHPLKRTQVQLFCTGQSLKAFESAMQIIDTPSRKSAADAFLYILFRLIFWINK